MSRDTHREFKDRPYGQFARIGKALSSPHRLEILELLAQGERTVDSLATEVGLSLANTSQHLQALREATLVESRKDGLFVSYRLSDPTVFELCTAIRTVAERQLADLERLVRERFGDRSGAEAVEMNELFETSAIERCRRARYAASERVRRWSHCRRDFGTSRRSPTTTAAAPQRERVRRVLPRTLLCVRGSRRRDSAFEWTTSAPAARRISRMAGSRSAG